ncbi:hypothetical protein [Mucilaginibacter sp. CSA2-8R]|uniref:hypothetical protein n=1 Tax=Mucilaginibacter sp. CSA2-8R TaxID=3141542 RepID=UPI00315CFED0
MSILLLWCSSFGSYAQESLHPIPVKVVKQEQGFLLTRGGKPYFVKGAGGSSYSEQLARYGGNSLRSWDTRNGQDILNKAQQLGLTVTMGLNVARERHGFDYNDSAAVHKQLETLRLEVRKYKNHPALLAWGIGNELNLQYTNPNVWDAVNGIAKMIHEEDPNHPATTMLAGINKREIDYITDRCPDLDFISVQVYGGLPGVPQQIRSAGWDGPYLVTEWGPTGHWEGPQTPWKASVEETSTQKAAVYKSRYEASIKADKHCLGSYVFLWGQKQERTPTWYGLFTENGEETGVVDVMQYLWTGHWPKNRAPELSSFLLNNQKATDNIYLNSAQSYPIALKITDPDNNKLAVRYELLPESTDLKEGGDRENRPQPLNGFVSSANNKQATLKAPDKEGAYRLFIYASDGRGKVATANIPFYVKSSGQGQ